MTQERDGRIGNLPANINIMNPVPNKDAKSITKLVRKNGKIAGYELSDGRVLSKREGVALAKQGGIRGVAIAATAASICAPSRTATRATTWGTSPAPRAASPERRQRAAFFGPLFVSAERFRQELFPCFQGIL